MYLQKQRQLRARSVCGLYNGTDKDDKLPRLHDKTPTLPRDNRERQCQLHKRTHRLLQVLPGRGTSSQTGGNTLPISRFYLKGNWIASLTETIPQC